LGKRFALLFVVLLVGTLITGCLGGGGDKPVSGFTVTGSVEEQGTGNPISGATVTLGSQTKTTNAEGVFEFTQVRAGTYNLMAEAEGYDSMPIQLQVDRNMNATVRLATDAPVVDIGALGNITDGAVLDDAKVTLSGNIYELLSERSGIASFNTAITIGQLQTIVNGLIYEIQVEADGSFEQEIPLDPGSNTIQLRVFDDHGHAGTSAILRVTVTLPRIDLRVILSWDTEGTDVDLHMFQRSAAEGNVVADYFDWDADRHVCWFNDRPGDFGPTEASNPVLDIDDRDGYGPETILLQEATPNYYHIWVHYFDAWLGEEVPPAEAEVQIIVNAGTADARSYEFVETLDESKLIWYVGTIVMPSGELIQVSPPSSDSLSLQADLLELRK
jgi:uncharacterized protein YfaP (DUF2135 family)